MILVVVVTSFVGNPQDEADKKALQSIVETNATGQALYRDLTHDFAHHAVFKRLFHCKQPADAPEQNSALCRPGGLDCGEHRRASLGRLHATAKHWNDDDDVQCAKAPLSCPRIL
ncbi:unnamed protein product [Cladocopium goreaui]|uniref:Pyruvate dehydrogenase [NADP(+)] n=1 Tax=Cladocopium goreaui TaxID=2562237 RepID=A0A9P1DE33_9DINO|nr:unnamed protein product [Cladocopium goreaui]